MGKVSILDMQQQKQSKLESCITLRKLEKSSWLHCSSLFPFTFKESNLNNIED